MGPLRTTSLWFPALALAFCSVGAPGSSRAQAGAKVPPHRVSRPFGTAAIQLKAGTLGFGVDLATPLGRAANLRVSGDAINYSRSEVASGITFDGELRFKSVGGSVDWFPFHGGFHISPGFSYRIETTLNATPHVPGGSTFYLDGIPYTSAPGDPIHGSGSLTLGTGHAVPSLTIGWGNMIPRSGRHWSVPVEFGAQYIGTAKLALSLEGTACQQVAPYSCGAINGDSESEADLQAEIKRLNNQIAPYRIYPVASIGLAYRF